jgi:hypothetical protein
MRFETVTTVKILVIGRLEHALHGLDPDSLVDYQYALQITYSKLVWDCTSEPGQCIAALDQRSWSIITHKMLDAMLQPLRFRSLIDFRHAFVS